MRKVQIVVGAAALAVFMIFVTTLSAAADTDRRAGSGAKEYGAQISQGTVTGATASQIAAARKDVAEEEKLPDYSQVVDELSTDRFSAPGWTQAQTNGLAHGGSYVTSTSGAGEARFKLKVPTSNDYSLYAWWPSREGNSTAARFGVRSASGTKWSTVDQTRDGGYWVKIGDYHMEAGDYQAVSISAGEGSGEAVADAVALVRGVASPPPDDLAPADGGRVAAGVPLTSSEATYSAARRSGRVSGRALIRSGRRHMGTPYRLSPPAPCIAYRVEDCSCFTRFTFRRFDKFLPDNPVKQWKYGHRVRSKSNLRRGDLVFFKESGYRGPITHVGLYAGNGNILHASSYFGKVVISKMKYMRGYYGAKRVRPRL